MKKPLPFKKKILTSLIRTAVVTAVAMPAMSWAQSSDANLRGKAAPQMQITAKNIATGSRRVTMSAADGSYALVGLPPGTYQVDAGPGTERTVTLSVASTATLDLTAPAAAAAAPAGAATLEGITVTGTALAEVKTSEIGNTVSLHQINTIPQITRNFLEFADTVPGMVFQVDSNGNTSLRGGAQSSNSINVYIDGVGQKNYVHAGGITGQTGSQGNPFPQLAIGEYKVITSNYKAEYDQISSAAVTAQTKSGTNEFHGEIFGTHTDEGLRDSTPAEKAAGKKTSSKEEEYGIAVGGPIIQDKMHFFFTYENKTFSTPTTVFPGLSVDGVNLVSLLPAAAQKEFGPSSKPFNEDLYFGKIDWEFSDRDRLEVSAKIRKETAVNNGGQTAPSAGTNAINDDNRFMANWQHSADAWTNELLVTYEKTRDNPSPVTTGNGADYTWALLPNNNTIVNTGSADPRAFQNKNQKGPAIQDDLTFSSLQWHGDHVIKMGVKFKKVDLTAQDASATNTIYYYDVTPNGTLDIPYKATVAKVTPGQDLIAKSSNKQYGVYIQDDWTVNDHLTLNLGVRWDYEETPSFENWVTPQYIINALNSPNPDPSAPAGQTYAQALALGGVNVNDYISNGHNRSAKKNQWQPRLGFSYDLNGDEEHVIIGGIGRAFDRNLFDYLQLERTKLALAEQDITFPNQYHPCSPGPTCVAWDPKYKDPAQLQALGTVGGEVNMFNNNIKVPYSDQFSIGMRNKVGDWNTSVTVARINSYDGLAVTLGNRYPDGSFWKNGSQPWGDPIPGLSGFIKWDNGIETRNTQLLLSAEKPYTKDSGWGLNIAYTYTHATQNRDINEHYSFDQASIQQYPFITSNAAAKHRLVVVGNYDGPWDITFAGKLTLATPTPNNGFSYYDYPKTAPNGAGNLPVAGTPGGGYSGSDSHAALAQSFLFGGKIFGYRQIDMQATKNFDLTRGMSFYLRFDVLNAFNYKNYSDYVTSYGSNGVISRFPVAYNGIGNITGVPRTFKLSAGFKF